MSELTEEQKLVKLGLRSPNQTESSLTETKTQLQTNIAEDWDAFVSEFESASLTSFDDFETWLDDNGFDSDTAANIRSKFESKYPDWSTFETAITTEYESWSDFENDFASNTGLRSTRQTDTGLSAAGIKVYEESGVGRSGQSIPAGGVEVYGAEVHFSQSGAVQDTADESAGTDEPIVWDNLYVDPNGLQTGGTIVVEADVTNNTGFTGQIVAELVVDGEVKKTQTKQLTGNSTITVRFEEVVGGIVDELTGTFDIGISKAGTESVTVSYGGL